MKGRVNSRRAEFDCNDGFGWDGSCLEISDPARPRSIADADLTWEALADGYVWYDFFSIPQLIGRHINCVRISTWSLKGCLEGAF